LLGFKIQTVLWNKLKTFLLVL